MLTHFTRIYSSEKCFQFLLYYYLFQCQSFVDDDFLSPYHGAKLKVAIILIITDQQITKCFCIHPALRNKMERNDSDAFKNRSSIDLWQFWWKWWQEHEHLKLHKQSPWIFGMISLFENESTWISELNKVKQSLLNEYLTCAL